MMEKQDIIDALELEKEDLLSKLESIEITILTLKQSLNIPLHKGYKMNGHIKNMEVTNEPIDTSRYKGYYTASSNKVKVAVILREENRFLHMRQIIKIAQSLEPNTDPEILAKQIPQAVYNLRTAGSVVNFQVGKSNVNIFWGSKSWIDEAGKIKPEYMYDENELSNNKLENIEI